MRRAVSVVLLAVLLAPSASGQQPLAGLDAYISKTMPDWKTPGLAIAVVKDGEVVFAHGYGVRESGQPAPVDTRTLFAIGSTTKAMTAALVGMLVDEKKVEWDAPVITYIPASGNLTDQNDGLRVTQNTIPGARIYLQAHVLDPGSSSAVLVANTDGAEPSR